MHCLVATLVDSIGTVALMTMGDVAGVSSALSVTYMAPIVVGQDVTVEARVIRSGRYLSTTQVHAVPVVCTTTGFKQGPPSRCLVP
jgi:acyl-coenzyme A thioesterase PaaI-like protein